MKRMLTVSRYATFILFALVSVTGIPAVGLHLITSFDGMAGQWMAASYPYSQEWVLYLVPTVAFTWGPPQFQFGGELTLPVGQWGDKYLAAMLLLRSGADDFYGDLGVGLSTRLAATTDPSLAYPDAPQFTCHLGCNWSFWTIGPGKLGLKVSADWLTTEYRPVITVVFPPWVLFHNQPWVEEQFRASVKLSVGVSYTLDF